MRAILDPVKASDVLREIIADVGRQVARCDEADPLVQPMRIALHYLAVAARCAEVDEVRAAEAAKKRP